MPTVNVNGEQLYYEEKGTGTPVVLLHGFPLDRRIWEAQLAGLSDRARIITPDLRGFGKSALAHPFTIESLAEDVHALLTQLNALPCILGGLSMGGYVTFAFTMKYAADLRALMLIDTKAEGDTPEARANRMKMIEACRAGGAKAVADMMEPKMTAPNAPPSVKQKARQIMEECSPATIENALQAMRDRRDYRDMLPSIAVPALVMVGDQDAFAPPSTAEQMCRDICHKHPFIIPNAGHLAPMENPERANTVIRAFLTEIGA